MKLTAVEVEILHRLEFEKQVAADVAAQFWSPSEQFRVGHPTEYPPAEEEEGEEEEGEEEYPPAEEEEGEEEYPPAEEEEGEEGTEVNTLRISHLARYEVDPNMIHFLRDELLWTLRYYPLITFDSKEQIPVFGTNLYAFLVNGRFDEACDGFLPYKVSAAQLAAIPSTRMSDRMETFLWRYNQHYGRKHNAMKIVALWDNTHGLDLTMRNDDAFLCRRGPENDDIKTDFLLVPSTNTRKVKRKISFKRTTLGGEKNMPLPDGIHSLQLDMGKYIIALPNNTLAQSYYEVSLGPQESEPMSHSHPRAPYNASFVVTFMTIDIQRIAKFNRQNAMYETDTLRGAKLMAALSFKLERHMFHRYMARAALLTMHRYEFRDEPSVLQQAQDQDAGTVHWDKDIARKFWMSEVVYDTRDGQLELFDQNDVAAADGEDEEEDSEGIESDISNDSPRNTPPQSPSPPRSNEKVQFVTDRNGIIRMVVDKSNVTGRRPIPAPPPHPNNNNNHFLGPRSYDDDNLIDRNQVGNSPFHREQFGNSPNDSDQVDPLYSDQVDPLYSDQVDPLYSDQVDPLYSDQVDPLYSDQVDHAYWDHVEYENEGDRGVDYLLDPAWSPGTDMFREPTIS